MLSHSNLYFKLRRKAVFFCMIFYLLFFPQFIIAQNDMRFEHITSPGGIQYESISKIVQDYQGFIWFGTWNELFKYDGIKFNSYGFDKNDTGISSYPAFCSGITGRKIILKIIFWILILKLLRQSYSQYAKMIPQTCILEQTYPDFTDLTQRTKHLNTINIMKTVQTA